MNVVNFTKRPDPAESTDLKTFTSHKMDWINAVVADHTLDASAKIVAICILQHVNKDTKRADPSDPTIADETGLSVSTVKRVRKDLRKAGWITWKRRVRSSLYWTLTEPMAAVAERQQALALARKERREERSPAFTDLSPMTEHDTVLSPVTVHDRSPVVDHEMPRMHQDTPPDDHDRSRVVDLDRSPVVDKHLLSNTQRKKVSKQESNDREVVDGGPIIISVAEENPPMTMATNQNQLVVIPADSVTNFVTKSSEFERWWHQYPKRVGKLKAQLEYAKAIKKGATSQELWDGAIRYAGERMHQDPKFTKHPTTWLVTAGGWLDEPQQPSKPTGLAAIKAGLQSFYYDEVRQ